MIAPGRDLDGGAGIYTDNVGAGMLIRCICPNCLDGVGLVNVDITMIWPTWTNNMAPPSGAYRTRYTYVCQLCERTAGVEFVYPAQGDGEQFRPPVKVALAWPERGPRPLALEAPEKVKSLFDEAAQCEAIGALRGAAGLYRACAEEIVRDRQQPGDDLQATINRMRGSGVDEDLIDALHDARLTGNWSLHQGVTFAPDEIEDLALLLTDVVEQIYAEPARRAEMRMNRDKRRAEHPRRS